MRMSDLSVLHIFFKNSELELSFSKNRKPKRRVDYLGMKYIDLKALPYQFH